MGTQGLIAIRLDAHYVFSQKCDHSAYPRDHGASIFGFLKYVDLDRFKRQCDTLVPMEQEEQDNLLKSILGRAPQGITDYERERLELRYPEIYWDTGAAALHMIYNGTLKRDPQHFRFGGQGLWCEWAWVIDLDHDLLRIHAGGFTYAIRRGLNHGDFLDYDSEPEWEAPAPGTDIPNAPWRPVALVHEMPFGVVRTVSVMNFFNAINAHLEPLRAKQSRANMRIWREHQKRRQLAEEQEARTQ